MSRYQAVTHYCQPFFAPIVTFTADLLAEWYLVPLDVLETFEKGVTIQLRLFSRSVTFANACT